MSLARVDSERTEKLSLAQESDDLVSTRRSDLNALTQQVGGAEQLRVIKYDAATDQQCVYYFLNNRNFGMSCFMDNPMKQLGVVQVLRNADGGGGV